MIKRRFYRVEHGDRDNATDSSSFSSDSELEVETSEEEPDNDAVAEESEDEETEDDSAIELKKNRGSCSTSSGLCQPILFLCLFLMQ